MRIVLVFAAETRHLVGVVTRTGELALVEDKSGRMTATLIEPTLISVL